MKVLLIIFISIFYFCFSKADINKFGEVYLESEIKSGIVSINATNFEMNEKINIIVKAIKGDVDEYIYYRFMSEVEMYRSPLQFYVNSNYKKTPVKTEISDTVKTYYYEIVKNKNEECLFINVLNFKKNDNSARLIVGSKKDESIIPFIILLIVAALIALGSLGAIVYACCCCERSNKHKKKTEIEDCQYSSAKMNLMPPEGTNYDSNLGEKPYYMK